jgi:hypothetical protein
MNLVIGRSKAVIRNETAAAAWPKTWFATLQYSQRYGLKQHAAAAAHYQQPTVAAMNQLKQH